MLQKMLFSLRQKLKFPHEECRAERMLGAQMERVLNILGINAYFLWTFTNIQEYLSRFTSNLIELQMLVNSWTFNSLFISYNTWEAIKAIWNYIIFLVSSLHPSYFRSCQLNQTYKSINIIWLYNSPSLPDILVFPSFDFPWISLLLKCIYQSPSSFRLPSSFNPSYCISCQLK